MPAVISFLRETPGTLSLMSAPFRQHFCQFGRPDQKSWLSCVVRSPQELPWRYAPTKKGPGKLLQKSAAFGRSGGRQEMSRKTERPTSPRATWHAGPDHHGHHQENDRQVGKPLQHVVTLRSLCVRPFQSHMIRHHPPDGTP